MADQDLIDETRRRLVSVVQCSHIKRAISSSAPSPHLNFWRVILGTLLDMAVLEWCVVFGADSEETHWKRVVPLSDHAAFRSGLLTATGLSEGKWRAYWEEMKTYRNNHLSHKGARKPGDIYPSLDHALTTAYYYYYDWLFRNDLLKGWPPSLNSYATDFSALAQEVAKAALGATNGTVPNIRRSTGTNPSRS
jgi:hypothetical protein